MDYHVAMKIERRELEAAVIAVLGPYLGDSMARAAVDGHCRSLGIGDSCGAAELETLVMRLRQGVTLFVGPEKAALLASALQRNFDSAKNS